MHVEVSGSFAPELRAPLAEIVRRGFDAAAGPWVGAAEVHVKAARPARRWRVRTPRGKSRSFPRKRDAVAFHERHGGELTVHDRLGQTWISGRAYDGVPELARVAPGARWLVTIRVPVGRDGRPTARYPRTWHYAPYKTAPVVEIATWDEELLHAAAHEARHVRQFAEGLPRSEVDAERVAAAVLEQWRAPAPVVELPPPTPPTRTIPVRRAARVPAGQLTLL